MLRRLIAGCFAIGLMPPVLLAAAPPPRLIESAGGENPIQLQRLQITAEISGGLAQTTVQMVFFNPNQRPLEGKLQFPLLPNQRVRAFALDIDGELRPAVPVEKTKGRQIFEEVERRRIDPALLETTQGDNFRLRIYPIAAGATRSVELKYTEPLSRRGATWSYRLPLAYADRLQNFSLAVKINGSRAAPRATGSFGPIRFTQVGESYRADVARSRFSASGSLLLQVPANPQVQSFIQEREGETYFIAEIPVTAARTPRRLPDTVGLLWDSSGSGASRRHGAELAELDRYFKALRNAHIRLIRLRDRAEAIESFEVVEGNWSALRTALQRTVYDGATSFGGWQPQAEVGEYLLISDGLANFGNVPFPTLRPGQRLYALNSALVADTGRLAALAERNGGRLLQVVPQTPGAAAQALLSEGVHLSNLEAGGATELEVESAEPQNGVFRIAGKLQSAHAELRLTLSQNAKSRLLTVPVNASAPAHPLAAHLWASYRMNALEADHDLKRAEIRRIGKQFGVPTRETSLIVLDRLDDYLRYDILPPASLRAEFDRRKNLRRAQLKQTQEKHLESIVREFEQKVAWWEKQYPKGDKPPDPLRPSFNHPSPPRDAPTPAPAGGTAAGGAPPGADPAMPAETVRITLKKWTPDAPYIARMKAAGGDSIYAIYLDERPDYAGSSAFFLDAADMLLEKGLRDLALRVLSNLAEMDLENRHVLRILGYRLLQADAPELAIPVFEKVQQMAEEEPQSFRDLGLALAAAGHYQQAIDQLNEVVVRPWDERFAEVGLIALTELNAIISTAQAPALDTSRIDPRLLKNLPLDLRAVLTWDADNTDIDLWVTDPNGEKCYYSQRFTYQGGRMSRDFTGGYGPEEFSLRVAKPGKYRIEANSYGDRQQIVAGATTLQVNLTSGFGTVDARERMLTLRVRGRGDTVFVGEFEVKPK